MAFSIHFLLSTLYLPFSIKLLNFDSGLFQHLHRQDIRIAILIDHLLNSCINDHLRANNARMVRTIQGSSPDLDAMVGSLDNRILLGMKAAAELVSLSGRNSLFLSEATNIQTVFHPGRSSIVTCGQNLLILDEDSPHLSPQAGGSFGNEVSNIHEIFFPGGSMRRTIFFLFLFLFQG